MAIQVGDSVRIIFSPEAGGSNQTAREVYKVEVVRSNSPGQIPFWELSLGGIQYVYDCPLILRKVDP